MMKYRVQAFVGLAILIPLVTKQVYAAASPPCTPEFGKGWILKGVHTGTCGASFEDFIHIITNIIGVLLNFGFVFAVIWLTWGGLNYIMSRGRPDLIDKAFQTIKYAIVGLVIIMLAKFIIYGINSFVLTSGLK
jgi:hypothetical protein